MDPPRLKGPPITPELVDTIHRAMHRRLGADAAADATLDLFERVCRTWTRFDPGRGTFGAWVWGFVVPVVADARREEAKRARITDAAILGAAGARADTDDDDLLPASLPDTMREGLMGLSVRDRRIVLARAVEEWPIRDIAEHLGMTVTAVTTAYNRALGRLNKRLRLADMV